ncbi:MAG: SpoIIIAH-like family protein [Peptostreptococcales bacterium]
MFYLFKKVLPILWIVIVISGISIINYKIQNNNILETSSELIAYEKDQLEKMRNEIIVSETTEPSQDEEIPVVAQQVQETFRETQSQIDMDRNKILSMLTSVIEDREVNSESRNQASIEKIKIIGYINQEIIVENLLKNKGFNSVFVLITDNSVNITVEKSNLSKSDVAKIADITMRETKRPIDQIIIQNKI